MNQAEIIIKWKKYFENNKTILKELVKYENINLIETNFLSPCLIIDQHICAPWGVGLNKINTLTVRNFLITLVRNIDNLEENDLIFIASDGTQKSDQLIKELALVKLEKGKFCLLYTSDAADEVY